MINIFSKALFVAIALFSFDLGLENFQDITFSSDLNHANEAFWAGRSGTVADSPLAPIPAQIPGPADLWAGGNSKTISMSLPFRGPYGVTVSFLDSHESSPPLVKFTLNGEMVFSAKVAEGSGAFSYDWISKGKRSTIKFETDGNSLLKHENILSMHSMEGSWAAIKSVSVKRIIPFWKWIIFFFGWIIYFIILLNIKASAAVDDESREKYLDSIAFAFCIALTFFFVCSYAGKFQYSADAYFGGDTWEYQSMGANFAFWHGVNRVGGIESFEKYRFPKDTKDKDPAHYEAFINKGRAGGKVNTYRTPGYAIFLGIVYMVYGVSPYIAKLSQLILLIVVAGFLPYVGRMLLGWEGFMAGGLSGYFLLSKWGYEATHRILTESLIIAVIFVTLAAYAAYRRRPGRFYAFFFGVSLGISLLVKGSLIFIPPLFILLIALENICVDGGSFMGALIRNIREKGAILASVCIGFLMALAPWSVYATANQGSLVVLSTQASSLLPASNNEYSLDGGWHPEGKSGSKSFYQKKDIRDLPTTMKVVLFYAEHTEMIPDIFLNKLNRGFDGFSWFKILMICMIAELLAVIFFAAGRRMNADTVAGWVSMALAASLIFIIMGVDPFARLLSAPVQFIIISATFLFLLCATITKKYPATAPPSLLIYVADIVLVTIITHGEPRFVFVFDFVFMMIAFYYTLYLMKSFYITFSQGRFNVEEFPFGSQIQPASAPHSLSKTSAGVL